MNWGREAAAEHDEARALEVFQAVLIAVMAAGLAAGGCALKGGGNLRFFLESERLSRDLDFDLLGDAAANDRFADRFEAMFASATMLAALRRAQLEVTDLRRHKDTPVTKRWKFSIRHAELSPHGAASKVEFSAREEPTLSGPPLLGTMRSRFTDLVPGRVPRILHYRPAQALEQKVHALSMRSETEPRDVFDIDFLVARHPREAAAAHLDARHARQAVTNIWAIAYGDYERLVERYLEDAIRPLYSGQQAWDDLRLRVATRLEEQAGPFDA